MLTQTTRNGLLPKKLARVARRRSYPKGRRVYVACVMNWVIYEMKPLPQLRLRHPGQSVEMLGAWRWRPRRSSRDALSDREAADAVRGRIDFKHALGLEFVTWLSITLCRPNFERVPLLEMLNNSG